MFAMYHCIADSGVQRIGSGQLFPLSFPGFMWKLIMSTAVAIAFGGLGHGNSYAGIPDVLLQYSSFCP